MWSDIHQRIWPEEVAALHQGTPGQMSWLEDPPPCLLLCFSNSVNKKIYNI